MTICYLFFEFREYIVERMEIIMAKEFIYSKTKEIGKLEENTTVEIGHYKVDGKDMPDKIYLVNHFTRKNGSEDSKATAICKVEGAKQLGKLLIGIE